MKNKVFLSLVFLLALLIPLRLWLYREKPRRPAAGLENAPEEDPLNQDRLLGGAGPATVPDPSSIPPRKSRGRGGSPAKKARSVVTFSPPPGRYPGPVEVSMEAALDALSIRYTLDFTEPHGGSSLYEEPVKVARSAIFRVALFEGEESVSPAVSASYFIDRSAGPGPLPVFSISMDPRDFVAVHISGEGRGLDFERPAHLEVIDIEGRQAISTGFGLRLHGGYGRSGGMETKKAYRAYFRKRYGAARLRFPVIPDTQVAEFDRLVLRSGYNDRLRPGRGEYNVRAAYIRDQVIRDLHRDMGCPAAHGSWCLLHVNLKSWGLFNIVERLDEEFLSAYLGKGSWDVIDAGEGAHSGSMEEWRALEALVSTADLSTEEGHAEIARRVDLENFTAYIILNLWIQNYDWPHRNWYAARKREPEAKWLFLSWDAEWGEGRFPKEAFHASLWAHVHFLLEGDLRARQAFFSALEAWLGKAGGSSGYPAFRATLQDMLDPVQAEADLRSFIGKL